MSLSRKMLCKPPLLLLLVGVCLALLPLSAMAVPKGGLDSLSVLSDGLTSLFDAAKDYYGKLIPMGLVFLAVAVVLQGFSLFMKFFMGGGGAELMSGFLRMILLGAIPIIMFASWPEIPAMLMNGLTSGIPSELTGGSGSAEQQMAMTITKLSNAFTEGMVKISDPDGNVIVQAILDALASVILFFPLLFFILAMLFAVFGPLITLHLGIILGPVVIPWMVWKPLDSWAMKWLTFMVSAGLAFAVGLLMANIVADGLGNIGATISSAAAESGTGGTIAFLASIIPMAGLLLFCAVFMLKCESIAAGVVGGGHIGGGLAAMAGAAMMAKAVGGAMKKKDDGDKGDNKGDATPTPPSSSAGGNKGNGKAGDTGADLSKSAGQAANDGGGGNGGGGEKPGGGGGGGGEKPSGGAPGTDAPEGGDTPSGDTPSGDAPGGDAPAGDAPGGDAPGGDAPGGDAPAGDAPGGDAPAGDAPGGDAPAGDAAGSGESTSPPSKAAARLAAFKRGAEKVADAGFAAGKKVAGSGVGKLAAVSAAGALVGPAAVVAVGAYAVSPGVRKAVGVTAKAAGDGAKWAAGKVSAGEKGESSPEKK